MLLGSNILIKTPGGENLLLEIQDGIEVSILKERLEEITGMPVERQLLISQSRVFGIYERLYAYEGQVFWLDDNNNAFVGNKLMPKKSYTGQRDYYSLVSKGEKKDIRFILKTLAQRSLPALLANKSKLKRAGDRVLHVHPLRFLECIFSDEELKAYIHNLKKRGGIVWKEFFNGLSQSLQEEINKGNLNDYFLYEFCSLVDIDISLIYGSVQAYQWEEFVKILIVSVPREGDTGRYDQ